MSSNTPARILGAALLILCMVSVASAAEVNYSTSDTFTVPAGVTQITVELWGAGGSGGTGARDGGSVLTGGGGAGGQYSIANITVTSGQQFNITVAGTTAASAQTGADTTFWNGTGNLVVAKGGAGGTNAAGTANGVGGLGSTSGGVGDIVYAGGSGGDGATNPGDSGGGGGGAGSSGAGGSATGGTAGTGTANRGGDGGTGVTGNNVNGNPGSLAGGGGSGGSRDGGTGGTGAAGYARITYEAPPAAPTGVSATDGSLTDRVTVTWTQSADATGYYVYTNEDGLIATLGDVATYDHTTAPAGTITPGTASATDGTNRDNVTLSLAGESTANGATRTYYVVATNSAGNSSNSATNTGYRGIGTLTYQWQRSAADSDASYTNIGGATTDPYTDTGAPQTGEGRYYRAVLDATGATQQISTVDRGFVNVTPFFSNFDGATTDFAGVGDLSAVSQPILEISTFGRIQWYGTLDVRDEDFDTYVAITDNSIDVTSASLGAGFNSRAEIRFYGLPYATEPVIFKDGDSCGPPLCNITSYSGGTLIANVSGFSEYTTADFTATPNQTWTVTAWVNIDDTGATQYLIEGINLGLKLVNATSDRMLMHLNSGAHEYTAYTAPGLLAGQGWKHVAFVFRADDDYRRIYVNGVNETILGPNIDNTTVGLSSTFDIGVNASGVIDEVMIFKRALAESEIDAIYRAGLYPYRVNLTGLAEGNYTFVSYSVDEAGNYNSTEERTITVSTSLDCGVIDTPGEYTLTRDVSSTGTCFTINVSDVSLDCAGYTINYSQSSEGYGVLVWSQSGKVENVNVSNCNIVKDSGGNSTSWRPAILGYGRSAVPSGEPSNAEGDLHFIDYLRIENVSIVTDGDYSSGIHGTRGRRWSIDNVTIDTSGLRSYGIYGTSHGSFAWDISDIVVNTSGSTARGIFGIDAHWNITRGTVTTQGLTAEPLHAYLDSQWNVTDSHLQSVLADDVYINLDDAERRIRLINTTFNVSKVNFPNSLAGYLDVGWYVDLYVNDTIGDPVIANINYTDAGELASNPTLSGTGLVTGADGFYRDLVLYEYSENFTSRYYHTNYTFNVSNSSYNLLTEAKNFSDNTQLNFALSNEPTVQNVTIFSSSGLNTTNENLSATFDVVSVVEVYNNSDWRVNGESIALVNLPLTSAFVNDTSVFDISSYARHGERVSGVTYDSSDGPFGRGAINQSGTSPEHVRVSDTLTPERFTLAGWYRPQDDGHYAAIALNERSQLFCQSEGGWKGLYASGTERFDFVWCTPDQNNSVTNKNLLFSDSGLGTGWMYLTVTFDANGNVSIYVNGTLMDTNVSNGISYNTSESTLRIGAQGNGYNVWNGSYNSFVLYNRSLSKEQVSALWQAAELGYPSQTIVSQETIAGENWSVSIVAATDDVRSTPVLSDNLTILDADSPTWRDNRTNETLDTPRYNEFIEMNVTLNDDTQLDAYVFSWNNSGSWVNDSSVDIGGTEHNVSVSKQVTRTKGETIAWRVYFNDTNGNENVTDVFTFTVKNTPPPVPVLDYPADNEAFLTNRTPRYNWTQEADADGDSITYQWHLALDETFTSIAGTNASVTNEYYDQLSALDFTTYWWRVSAYDGEDYSENSTTFNFTVTSLVSIDLYNATPDFGNMSLGDVNDTTDSDPLPITVRNTGNIEANVSINATALWESEPLDTSFYQVKIRQAEIGAYDLANLTYVNLSATPKVLIENLGWEDAADEAYIDIRVQAPLAEYPGAKNSTIRVIAS